MSERNNYRNGTEGSSALEIGYVEPLRIPRRPKFNQPAREVEETEPKVKRRIARNDLNVYRMQPKTDANFAKINRLCTIVLAFVIIATIGVCVLFLNSHSSYGDLNTKIESAKRELNTLKRENAQLEEDLNNMIDLEMIYEVATTRLNMRLPGPSDVYVINSEPVTYTTKYGPVKVEKDEVTVGNVLGYITKGW